MRTFLAAAASIAILTSQSARAAPTSVSNGPVTSRTTIVKPLTLTKLSDLDFGSIIVQDNGTVSMATTGAITCTSALTCSANGTPAQYKVTGTNNQVVNVTKPNVVLTNASNPGTPLTLVLAGPAQVTLPNSGSVGTNFSLGGSIVISAATKDGVYAGVLAVTVDYN
jgi:hypothetical protein